MARLTRASRRSSKQSVVDEAEAQIAAEAAHPVSQAQLERAAVQGMLAALDDQWSAYYAPGDYTRFEQVLAGSYTGVGVWVRRAADGSLAGPVDRAGVAGREGRPARR